MTHPKTEQLAVLKQKLAAIYKAERALLTAERRLTIEKQQLATLFKVMSKEEQDVKKLESFSLTALYHDLFGDKQQQLNQEQTEFFAAKLKYDSCLSQVNSIKNEIVNYHQLIKQKSALEAEFKVLIGQVPSGKNQQLYLQLITNTSTAHSCLQELREARAAGEQALQSTNKALDMMKSASNWGVFDMVGGGLLATAVKHNKMGNAQREMETMRNRLDLFHRELQDVKQIEYQAVDLHISMFSSVADFVLDGLIFDWMVQSKINQCKHKLTAVADETKRMMSQLNQHIEHCKQSLTEQQLQLQQLLADEVY